MSLPLLCTVGPLLKREYECAKVGAEGDRTHSGRAGDHSQSDCVPGPISATVLNGPKEEVAIIS